MAAYLVLLFAVLSRVLPPAFHVSGVNFTAVGGSLLFFGSKMGGARMGRWQAGIAIAALAATDYFLTVFAYGYPFQTSAYLATWVWYGAICLVGPGSAGTARGLAASGRGGAGLRHVVLPAEQLHGVGAERDVCQELGGAGHVLRRGTAVLCQRCDLHPDDCGRVVRAASAGQGDDRGSARNAARTASRGVTSGHKRQAGNVGPWPFVVRGLFFAGIDTVIVQPLRCAWMRSTSPQAQDGSWIFLPWRS